MPSAEDQRGVESRQAGRVVIVGGAIMGSFTAWWLRRRGFAGEIVVVEKDPSYQLCSTALSAASIRTQFTTPANIAMSLFGADFFRRLRETFGAQADIGFREDGYLILGAPEEAASRRAAVAAQRKAGADVVALAPAEIAARFPFVALDGVGIGTFGQSGEGWFDAWSLLSLVRSDAKRLGVTFVHGEVEAVEIAGDRVTGVRLADGSRIDGDWCVIAAGPASGALMARCDVALPVSPRKRTVFSFRAPVATAGFPMLFDTSGIWVRPEGEGYIGGIQPPVDRDPDATGDFEPHHELMEEMFWPLLAARIPAMEQLRLDRAWAGHYEVNGLDHNGVVGPHDKIPNLLFATGFSGHGVMHAPAVGRAVAEWIVDGRFTTIDLSSLGYHRISEGRPLLEGTIY